VFGLRYRGFVPAWGLHPALSAQTPLRLVLRHPGRALNYLVSLHEWRPDAGAYAGLPETPEAAGAHRAERITLDVLPTGAGWVAPSRPSRGLGPFCLDLRGLSGDA
jgi:hypothetical protein